MTLSAAPPVPPSLPPPAAPPRDVIIVSGGGVTLPVAQVLSASYDIAFLSAAAYQAGMGEGWPGLVNMPAMMGVEESEAVDVHLSRLSHAVLLDREGVAGRLVDPYLRRGLTPPRDLAMAAEWVGGFVLSQARDAVTALVGLATLARQRRVVACLTHEDVTPPMRALVGFAAARGIPSFHLPHAACHLDLTGAPDIHRETATDYLLAHGPVMADWYAAHGFNPERIAIVGMPSYDKFYRGGLPSFPEARRVLSILERREDGQPQPVIMYAATWAQATSLKSGFEAELKAGFAAVCDLAERVRAILIIKLHPHGGGDETDYFERALKERNLPGLITRTHLTYCLRAADVVIAQGPSNIVVEAAIVGTPAVYIQTEGFDFATQPVPYRAGPDWQALAKAVEAATGLRNRPEWSHDFPSLYNATHGTPEAAENAANFILTVIGGGLPPAPDLPAPVPPEPPVLEPESPLVA